MGMLLVTLSLITAFAALVGVFINRRQLSQQRIELSKEYVKELIALALYPQMRRCAEVLDKLAKLYFAEDYKTGWPQVYGKPPELSQDQANVLSIGTFSGRPVFSFPEPSFGILSHRFYFGNETLVMLRMRDFENTHKATADRIRQFDADMPQLDRVLWNLAVEVKKSIAVTMAANPMSVTGVIASELGPGLMVSHVAEINFNYLLLNRSDFESFLDQFDRKPAKEHWLRLKDEFIADLNESAVREAAVEVKSTAVRLNAGLQRIAKELDDIVSRYRKDYFITMAELPPHYLMP